jgi:hypothetical protein
LVSQLPASSPVAAPAPVVFYTGDTYPQFVFQLVYADGSGAIDLTNAQVSVSLVPIGAGGTAILGAAVSVFDAAGGICTFSTPAPFSLPPGLSSGLWEGQLLIDFGSGRVQSSPIFPITVLRRLAG